MSLARTLVPALCDCSPRPTDRRAYRHRQPQAAYVLRPARVPSEVLGAPHLEYKLVRNQTGSKSSTTPPGRPIGEDTVPEFRAGKGRSIPWIARRLKSCRRALLERGCIGRPMRNVRCVSPGADRLQGPRPATLAQSPLPRQQRGGKAWSCMTWATWTQSPRRTSTRPTRPPRPGLHRPRPAASCEGRLPVARRVSREGLSNQSCPFGRMGRNGRGPRGGSLRTTRGSGQVPWRRQERPPVFWPALPAARQSSGPPCRRGGQGRQNGTGNPACRTRQASLTPDHSKPVKRKALELSMLLPKARTTLVRANEALTEWSQVLKRARLNGQRPDRKAGCISRPGVG